MFDNRGIEDGAGEGGAGAGGAAEGGAESRAVKNGAAKGGREVEVGEGEAAEGGTENEAIKNRAAKGGREVEVGICGAAEGGTESKAVKNGAVKGGGEVKAGEGGAADGGAEGDAGEGGAPDGGAEGDAGEGGAADGGSGSEVVTMEQQEDSTSDGSALPPTGGQGSVDTVMQPVRHSEEENIKPNSNEDSQHRNNKDILDDPDQPSEINCSNIFQILENQKDSFFEYLQINFEPKTVKKGKNVNHSMYYFALPSSAVYDSETSPPKPRAP
ncbi:golgin subfamily A member 6-like protein 2 [Trichomycterus rosablanca]|uniref:golgin subfamily A member 6-like protein 2 n=1 Tax=Trichomycterus rosablanca TaxID=2290929 RepID=UPI002F35A878